MKCRALICLGLLLTCPHPWALDWTIEVIDDDFAGNYAVETARTPVALALDPFTGHPWVTWNVLGPESREGVKLARFDGDQWNVETVVGGSQQLTAVDLEFDPVTGDLYVLYRFFPDGIMRLAMFDGEEWSFTAIDPDEVEVSTLSAAANSGEAVWLLIDPHTRRPTVAFSHGLIARGFVLVATYDGEEWEIEKVFRKLTGEATTGFSLASNPVTGELSLAFGTGLGISITTYKLFFGRRTETGWEVEEIPTGVPFESNRRLSLAFEPETVTPFIQLQGQVRLYSFDGEQWTFEQGVSGESLVFDPLTSLPMTVTPGGGVGGVLRLNRFDGSVWVEEIIDTRGGPSGSLFRSPSISIHPETGQIFIAYLEEGTRDIRVAKSNPRANRASEWMAYE